MIKITDVIGSPYVKCNIRGGILRLAKSIEENPESLGNMCLINYCECHQVRVESYRYFNGRYKYSILCNVPYENIDKILFTRNNKNLDITHKKTHKNNRLKVSIQVEIYGK